MKNKIDIYVASHKHVEFKIPSFCHFIKVNSVRGGRDDEWLNDGDFDNISEKNYSYCELTALYSLWKNSNADIKGLFHYRRFFSKYSNEMGRRVVFTKQLKNKMITQNQIYSLLDSADIIVETPYLPYPNTVRQDLEMFCFKQDIENMENIISTFYPDYKKTWDDLMNDSNASYCNMFITTSKLMDDYCSWLFELLSRCEEVCDISDYDIQHARIYGYFGEVLMNLYIRRNHLKCSFVDMLEIGDFITEYKKQDNIKQMVSLCLEHLHVPVNSKRHNRIKNYRDNKNRISQ